MIRTIKTTRKEAEWIARLFGCTYRFVLLSLSYERDSLRARKIRKVALERGGVELYTFRREELPEDVKTSDRS